MRGMDIPNKRRCLLPNDNYTEGVRRNHFLYVAASIKFFTFDGAAILILVSHRLMLIRGCRQYEIRNCICRNRLMQIVNRLSCFWKIFGRIINCFLIHPNSFDSYQCFYIASLATLATRSTNSHPICWGKFFLGHKNIIALSLSPTFSRAINHISQLHAGHKTSFFLD